MASSQQPQPSGPFLKRLKGASKTYGPEFEYKLAGLVALRARRKGLRFEIFTNVECARPFDDVVLRVLGPSPAVVCVQLKHTGADGPPDPVTTQAFTSASTRADFSLKKYFEVFPGFFRLRSIYHTLSEEEAFLFGGPDDHMRVVLYTNRPVPRRRGAGDAPHLPFDHEDLFRTDDRAFTHVFAFGRADQEIWRLFENTTENDTYQHDFLPRLRVFSQQRHANDLDEAIHRELDALFGAPLPRSDLLLVDYIALLKRWGQDDAEGRPLSDSSGELERLLLADLAAQGRAAAGAGALAFREAACRALRKFLDRMTRGALHVRVRGVPQGLRAAKALQLLDERFAGRWGYVGDRQLREVPRAALEAACGAADVVVVDVQEQLEAARALVAAVGGRLRVVVVSSAEDEHVLQGPSPQWEPPEEDWRLDQLTTQAQERFLDAELLFQGEEMCLRALEETWPRLREEVDGALLSALVCSGVKPVLCALPPALDDADHHIERSFRHATLLDPALLTQLDSSQHLLALSGFSEQELQQLQLEIDDNGKDQDDCISLNHVKANRLLRLEDVGMTEHSSNMAAAFHQLCQGNAQRSVHWVEKSGDGALVWRATRGDGRAVAERAREVVEGARCRPTGPHCVHEGPEASAWAARVLLLLGEPGAGKSSFVARAAAEARRGTPQRWAVVVRLLEHRRLLDNMPPPEEIDKGEVVALLAAAAGIRGTEADASRRCLEAALFTSGAITVYVDGVDEVAPVHEQKALRLLQLYITKSHPHARLWVAARLEMQATLCRAMSCSSPLTLLPLTRPQQVRYLTKQWAEHLHADAVSVEPLARQMVDAVAHSHSEIKDLPNRFVNNCKIKDCMLHILSNTVEALDLQPLTFESHLKAIDAFLNALFTTPSKSLFDVVETNLNNLIREVPFIGKMKEHFIEVITRYLSELEGSILQVPLHLKMAAEGFVEAADDTLKSGGRLLTERINQYSIFHRFIDLKRKHFQIKHEKTNINSSTWIQDVEEETFRKIHQAFALKIFSIFIDEIHIQPLQEDLEKFEKYLPKEKTGLLWESENNQPRFAHFCYVEFFISTWLFEKLSSKHSEEAKAIVRTLFKRDFNSNVVLFLDHMLCEGRRLHEAVLQGAEAAGVEAALGAGEAVEGVDACGRSALHLAAAYGRSGAVDALLARGASCSRTDALMGWTPLQYADAALQVAAAERLLAAGADAAHVTALREEPTAMLAAIAQDLPQIARQLQFNSTDKEHEQVQRKYPSSQLLGFAAQLGSFKVMNMVLVEDPEVNVNVRMNDDQIPLHKAAMVSHEDIVKILVLRGSKINIKDKNEETPLHVAVRGGNLNIVKMLTSSENIHICNKKGSIPLHLATCCGHERIVEYLVSPKPDLNAKGETGCAPVHITADSLTTTINAQDDTGCQAIHMAAFKGYRGIVRILLDAGADIESVNEDNFAPLHCAASKGHEEVMKYLLSRGAHVNADTGEGQAIHIAALFGHRSIAEILLDSGADIEAVDGENFTPLLCAVQEGHEEVMKHLLIRGANVHARNSNEDHAVHIAAVGNHRRILEILVNAGADIEAVNKINVTPLHIAALRGHEEVMEYVLSRGANIDARDAHRNQAIHIAALEGHRRIVEILVNAGADIEAVNKINATPLYNAASEGHEEVMKCLLSLGANINASDANENQAIHIATHKGHRGIVEILVNAGADIEAVNKINYTPLYTAALGGDEELTKYLLSRGANVNARDTDENQAIHAAAIGGHRDMVQILLDSGADVESVEKNNAAPLYFAALGGHEEVMKYLLSRGANINARDNDQEQAIHIAARNGHRGIVETLLVAGADIESANVEKANPLHIAAHGGHEDVMQYLLSRGANVNARCNSDYQAIHLAARKGHRGIVETLLAAGANIESVDEINATALHCAAQVGHEEVMKYLLSREANINARTADGNQAIHWAAFEGHRGITEILLDAGADIEAVNNDNFTPLHCAAQGGHEEVMKNLLAWGANLNARDNDQDQAIHVAARNGHRGITEILLDAGADIEAVNKNNFTPLHYAARESHEEVMKCLLSRGANTYP